MDESGVETEGNEIAKRLLEFLYTGGKLDPLVAEHLAEALSKCSLQNPAHPPPEVGKGGITELTALTALTALSADTVIASASEIDLNPEAFASLLRQFKNNVENNNWNTLTPEEQVRVRQLTAALIKDIVIFYIKSSKPHGLTRQHAYTECCGYTVQGNREKLKEIDASLRANLSASMLQALVLRQCEPSVIQIIDNPQDSDQIIIYCQLPNSTRSSLNDDRVVTNRYILVLNKNCPVIESLRSGQDQRLFSFALRYAAVFLNSKSKYFFDVPLEGTMELGGPNMIVIIDQPARKISSFSTRLPGQNGQRVKQAENDGEFADLTKTYGGYGINFGDGKWPGLSPNLSDFDLEKVLKKNGLE